MHLVSLVFSITHGQYPLLALSFVLTSFGQPIYAILAGHKHHNKTDVIQGIKVVMGGSFIGMDDYCVQKRIFGRPEQVICVCDQNGIRCTYDVALN